MNGLGLAAPNRIRCTRAAVARPYGGSLRLRGLVVDKSFVCPRCPRGFATRHGLASHMGQVCFRGTWQERFWAKVDRRGPDGCWEWQAATSDWGYGVFRRFGVARRERAHRIAYELLVGPIPAGLWALHRCDNPPCVNPAHLFLGTPADNVHDRDAKGRRGKRRWFRAPAAEYRALGVESKENGS